MYLQNILDAIAECIMMKHKDDNNGGHYDITIMYIKDETKDAKQLDCYKNGATLCLHLNEKDYNTMNELDNQVMARFVGKYDDKDRYSYNNSVIVTKMKRDQQGWLSLIYFISSDGTDKLVCFYGKDCCADYWTEGSACQCEAICQQHYREHGCPMCGAQWKENKKRERD